MFWRWGAHARWLLYIFTTFQLLKRKDRIHFSSVQDSKEKQKQKRPQDSRATMTKWHIDGDQKIRQKNTTNNLFHLSTLICQKIFLVADEI